MRVAIVLLVVAIAVLPRIPLGIPLPGRTFDLRVEDLLLVGLLAVFLVQLARGRKPVRAPPLVPMAAYVGVAAVTTAVALWAYQLHGLRALLYLGKEVEYFVLFLLAVNWLRSREDVDLAARALLAVGAANAAWFAIQLATGDYRQLLAVPVEQGSGAFVGAARWQSYGPQLIGESSPLSTGGFFMVVSLLALGRMLSSRERREEWIHGALAVVFFACVIVTLSRVSFVGSLLGAGVVVGSHAWGARLRASVLAAGAATLLAVLLLGLGVLRRLTLDRLAVSVGERVHDIWGPLLLAFLDRPIFGYGKGSIGILPGLGEGEAHNHYLRLLVEGGLPLLAAFLWLLATVVAVGMRLRREGHTPRDRTLGETMLGVTAAMAFAAFFQDAFAPVLLNEVFWILAALATVSARLDDAPGGSGDRSATDGSAIEGVVG